VQTIIKTCSALYVYQDSVLLVFLCRFGKGMEATYTLMLFDVSQCESTVPSQGSPEKRVLPKDGNPSLVIL